MNFKLFLREKASTILLLLFGLITIEIFLMAYLPNLRSKGLMTYLRFFKTYELSYHFAFGM